MMKKILAISADPLQLDPSLFPVLQRNCFGFALYCYFKLTIPNHPDIKRLTDVTSASHLLQKRYLDNIHNTPIINVEGIKERINNAVTITLKKIRSCLAKNTYPRVEDMPPTFILYFAPVDSDEGHAICVSANTIYDTRSGQLRETLDSTQLWPSIFQKMECFFQEKNPGKTTGKINMTTFVYTPETRTETHSKRKFPFV